jgi:hypothetical protein
MRAAKTVNNFNNPSTGRRAGESSAPTKGVEFADGLPTLGVDSMLRHDILRCPLAQHSRTVDSETKTVTYYIAVKWDSQSRESLVTN